MARFRGTVQGGRGEASRLGHQGLVAKASGWNGHIRVNLFNQHDGKDIDWVHVWHETNDGTKMIYNGPLNKHIDPRGVPIPLDIAKLVK